MPERPEEQLPSPEEIFNQVEQIPLAGVLVDAFKEHTDPKTWLVNKRNSGHTVDGNVKDRVGDHDKRLLTLEKWFSEGRLMVFTYKGIFEEHDYWGDLNFVAGVMEAGLWRADKGNLQTFGINVNINSRSLVLPSANTLWLFHIAQEISLKACLAYNQNQPQFWDLSSKYAIKSDLDKPESEI